MSYLNKVQREITLPSGYTCTVRRQTRLDAIEIGAPPAFFMRNTRLKDKGHEPPEETPEQSEEFAKFIARQNRVILTRCVIGHLCPTGPIPSERFTISDQPPGKEEPGSISWALLDEKDVDAIIAASNELSGYTPAGREAAKTFPEAEPSATRRNGCAGEALQPQPDGTAEPVHA